MFKKIKFIDRSRSQIFFLPFLVKVEFSIFDALQLENRRGELHQSFQMRLGADKGQIAHELDPQECSDDPSNRSFPFFSSRKPEMVP